MSTVHGVDEQQALAGYQRERNRLAAALMPPVARLAEFDPDSAVVEEAFRDMSAAMRDELCYLVGRDSGLVAA